MLKVSDLEKMAGELATKVHDVYDTRKTPLQAQLIFAFILETLEQINNHYCKDVTQE